jgi:hypothetical protein
VLRVDLTRSPRRRGMSAISAERTAGVAVFATSVDSDAASLGVISPWATASVRAAAAAIKSEAALTFGMVRFTGFP